MMRRRQRAMIIAALITSAWSVCLALLTACLVWAFAASTATYVILSAGTAAGSFVSGWLSALMIQRHLARHPNFGSSGQPEHGAFLIAFVVPEGEAPGGRRRLAGPSEEVAR